MPDDSPAKPAPPAAQPPTEAAGGALKLVPLVLVGLVLGVWVMRPAAPGARVESDLARAAAAIDAGQWLEAAPILDRIARDRSTEPPLRKKASDALGNLARRALEEKRSLKETAALLGREIDLEESDPSAPPTSARPDVGRITSATLVRALDRADAELATDPRGAVELASHVLHCVEGSDLEERAKATRTKALEAAVARDPKDVEALTALAGDDYAQGRVAEARGRLEPVADKLGTGDGARVLGLARLKGGAVDESVAFLSSYYEANMAAFDRATTGLRATIDASVRRAELDPSLAKTIRAARTDEERKRAHDDFLAAEVVADPDVRAARKAVVAASPLVDVALALAQVEIARSRGKDPGERESRLERASHYLESVGRLGVGNDNWWVWVARLKIESGKTADVERVVEAYLDGRGRTYSALYVSAQILAEANDVEPARARAEEAFEAAKEPVDRERAAELRARVAETPKDRLAWLARSGARPDVAAMLAQARAEEALAEGRFDDAVSGFAEAARFYDSPEGRKLAPPLHAALLSLAVARSSGVAADLDRAIVLLEKEASDEPPPLAALDALADALQDRAVGTVLGDRLQTSVLRDRGLDLLDAGALDEADAHALATRLAADRDMKRSLELRERSIAAAPRRLKSYGLLLGWATKLRDTEQLAALEQRVLAAGLDRVEEARQLAAYWSGKEDDARRRALGTRRKRGDALVALARTSGHAPTIAAALAARAALEREAGSLLAAADQGAADHDLAVKLDEEALALAPRTTTRLALRNALLARAAQRARAASPGLEALVRKHGKFGFVTVLGWAVRADASLAARLAQDPDVQRALALHAEAARGELDAQTHDWLVFAIAADPRAADAAKRVAASTLALLQARVAHEIVPTDPDVANELATVLELRGDQKARAKLLAEAKKAGVPLPYEVLEK